MTIMEEERRYSLRFLSGRSQGGDYVLQDPIEVVVGRSSDVDVILLEGMVSRRHARFSYSGGRLLVEDLGSTNGTFVNGEKVKRKSLREGDRILVGTSILKVVRTHKPFGTVPPRPDPALLADEQTAERDHVSGTLEEVSVPELLELFGSSQQNATLEIEREGDRAWVVMGEGLVLDCRIGSLPEAPAHKCIMRVLGWTKGRFFIGPFKRPAQPKLALQVPQLLVDGLFKLDELTVLSQSLPAPTEGLVLAKPLVPKLAALDERDLEVLQLAHNHGSVDKVLAHSPETDFDAAKRLLALFDAGYVRKA